MPAASSPSITEPPAGRAWRVPPGSGERSPACSGTASLTRHGHGGQAARRPALRGSSGPGQAFARSLGADVRGWRTGRTRRARLPGKLTFPCRLTVQRSGRPGWLSQAARGQRSLRDRRFRPGRPRRGRREQAARPATRSRYQMADMGMKEAEPDSTTDTSAPRIFRIRSVGTAVGGRHASSASTSMAGGSCAATLMLPARLVQRHGR